jgi:hypothetical protein
MDEIPDNAFIHFHSLKGKMSGFLRCESLNFRAGYFLLICLCPLLPTSKEMNKLHFRYFRVLSIVILGFASAPTFVMAQSRLGFQPTSTGAPGNREAGANRSGTCAQSDQGLVALLPQTNLAQTAEAYPAVYAYFPASSAQFAEFALYEEGSNELVYGTLFKVTGTPGLVSVQLPEEATLSPLTVGQRYYWYMSLICNVRNRASDITVQGNIERVTPSQALSRQLQSAAPSQYPFLYAEAGLWPETVSSLVNLSLANPGDPTPAQNLSDLLRSVGLDSIADQPLLR